MPKKPTIAKPATLPPARQAIIDHRGAVAAAEVAHEAAVVHRAQLLEVVEGPARTEAQIREAIAADKDALAEWINLSSRWQGTCGPSRLGQVLDVVQFRSRPEPVGAQNPRYTL